MDVTKFTPAFWLDNESECLNLLKTNYNLIPVLNANSVQDLRHNSLVRFYGMVQDMYDPEYYFEKYEVTNEVTKESYVKKAKYIDAIHCKDNEVVNSESLNNVTGERSTFIAISVPGLNKWVENIECEKFRSAGVHDTVSTSRQAKRTLRTEESMETDNVDVGPSQETDAKKKCISKSATQTGLLLSQEHLLNFPIPERSGKACHIKVYRDADTIKLNEMYAFVGFLSVDPMLTTLSNHSDDLNYDSEMENQTHNPPPSLIPRIHCVSWKKIVHNNPLVTDGELSSEKFKFLKNELLIALTQLLLGDELAAEYLVYHLISGVYLRRDLMALGKFTLNMSNIPCALLPDYGENLYKFIELLVPKSHYMPMTLENMNTCAFIPKKDYECNRLTSGLLQLSNNTHLVLDETKLATGKLNESGVKAVSALADVIKNQKVTYDFNYYKMPFDCDIPILILSEGKSFLPHDCHVVLDNGDVHIETFKDIISAMEQFLNPELVNDIRRYLTIARLQKYEISDSVQELIQNEFVNMRQTDNITADDLHRLLVLARLVCLSEGRCILDDECWKKTCSLEMRRKERLRK